MTSRGVSQMMMGDTKITQRHSGGHRCPTCHQHVAEKPQIEKTTIDGISFTVYRWKDGTTVDTPCKCFGATNGRAHSTDQCPWLKKRQARKVA